MYIIISLYCKLIFSILFYLEIMEFDSYESLSEKKIEVLPLVSFHFLEVLRCIKRRIVAKQTVRNPWMVRIRTKIPATVFFEWYRAVRDFRAAYGRDIRVVKDKKRKDILKEITITFYHIGPLKFHLLKAVDGNAVIKDYIEKKIGTSVGKIVVSREKPFIFTFRVAQGSLSINASYQIENRYGIICC